MNSRMTLCSEAVRDPFNVFISLLGSPRLHQSNTVQTILQIKITVLYFLCI